jgi:hypothetical protein
MGQLRKNVFESKRAWPAENFIEGRYNFFSKGDQPHIQKMGQIMFLIRWCYLTGFSCMGEYFILRNKIWKNELGGWSTKLN